MKSVPKLIRRFVGIMLLSSLLLIILNFALLCIYTLNQTPNGSPWITAQEVADALSQNENGYILGEDTALELQNTDVWAIFIDNRAMKVVWQTDNLPETVPMLYTVSDIASLTRGYIDGYPTFTGEAENGLVVLGYPKDSFWKHMWPSWDYDFIANLPKTILSVLAINIALIFTIYIIANSKLLKSVKPIVSGIQALSTNEEVHIREKGLLSGRWLPCGHLEACKRLVQIVVKGLHGTENFCGLCQEGICLFYFPVFQGIFQVPAFKFQVFCLGMRLIIPLGDIFQGSSLDGEIFGKRRLMQELFPFPAVLGNIIPYHGSSILKHVCKQAAS